MIFPIILAGGSGTRLWPLSRKSYPKQFSKILGKKSLFQDRVSHLTDSDKLEFENPIILTNDEFRFIVVEQLSSIGIKPHSVLIEPEVKSTAPAILAAAIFIEEKFSNAVLLVAPSDHVIEEINIFDECIKEGLVEVEKGRLVTFGIKPTGPETAYGYLELTKTHSDNTQNLKSFIEKPDKARAKDMFNSGKYLWNSGIFLVSTYDIIKAFEKYSPSMLSLVRKAVSKGKSDLDFFRLNSKEWSECESISIDHAILEKVNDLSVVPFKGKWSDLGAWDAVWREQIPDENGLVISENVTVIDCKNSLFRSEERNVHLVGLGLERIIAIAMGDAVLVASKDRAQDVKKVVSTLKSKGVPQAEVFPKEHRPWGWFESLVMGSRFQVKRIFVQVNASLSLQSHQHRSEHWVVVEGTAKVTINENIKLLTEGESIYVPLGAVHRLQNTGKISLVLIEIQTGSYLGEDDITRYDDIYSRNRIK